MGHLLQGNVGNYTVQYSIVSRHICSKKILQIQIANWGHGLCVNAFQLASRFFFFAITEAQTKEGRSLESRKSHSCFLLTRQRKVWQDISVHCSGLCSTKEALHFHNFIPLETDCTVNVILHHRTTTTQIEKHANSRSCQKCNLESTHK